MLKITFQIFAHLSTVCHPFYEYKLHDNSVLFFGRFFFSLLNSLIYPPDLHSVWHIVGTQ